MIKTLRDFLGDAGINNLDCRLIKTPPEGIYPNLKAGALSLGPK